MRGMEQPAAVLNTAVGAHLRHAHFHFQIEVLHDGAGTDIVNVVLPRRLYGVRMDCAVVDRPDVGLAFPSIECLAVPELDVSGVVVKGNLLRTASQTAALPSPAQRRENSRN